MSVSTIGLKNPDWDLTKSKVDVIDSWPLMTSPGPVLMILAIYLIFVLKIGPSYMQKREPFKLYTTLIAYNTCQVLFSAYMVYRFGKHMLKYGLLHSKCLLDQEQSRTEVASCVYLYFIAKVSELFDTVFFVIRKKVKQISFLHVYHHTIMMLGTWIYLKYAITDNVIFIGFMNSLVHVFMYSYYGLSSLGPSVAKYLWWKKYITTFQLVQFFSVLAQYLASLYISECPPSRVVYSFFIMNIFTFIALFSNFYRNSYLKKRSKTMHEKCISNGNTQPVNTLNNKLKGI